MALIDRIHDDLTTALRDRDPLRRNALRRILTRVAVTETAGATRAGLDDAGVISTIRSEVKACTDAVADYERAGRDTAGMREEIAFLASYLPAELDDDALAVIVAEEVAAAAAIGHNGPKAMGAVIKAVKARTDADGRRIAAAVRVALT